MHERLSNLLDGHEVAFGRFGSRTAMLLCDTAKSDGAETHGRLCYRTSRPAGGIEWNRRFKDRMDFYDVVKLCHYYRAQTKGNVESRGQPSLDPKIDHESRLDSTIFSKT